MTPKEIEQFRSILSKAVQLGTQSKCPCKIPEIRAVSHYKERTDFRYSVGINCFCHNGCNLVHVLLKKKSWSCPFCCAIVCDWECFQKHMSDNHLATGQELFLRDLGERASLSSMERDRLRFKKHLSDNFLAIAPKLAVPSTAIGGWWCPLCRKTSDLNRESTNSNISILYSEILMMMTYEEKVKNIYTTAVKNNVCPNCEKYKEKKICIPTKLQSLFSSHSYHPYEFYSSEANIPPFLSFRPILLGEILLVEDAGDDYAPFLTILLQQQSFPQSRTAFYDQEEESDILLYTKTVWKAILNHKGELKSITLPGSKTLVNIRGDIALFDNGMTETNLPSDLLGIIRAYTPMGHWYFESIISQIQNDAKRYGAAVKALLSMI